MNSRRAYRWIIDVVRLIAGEAGAEFSRNIEYLLCRPVGNPAKCRSSYVQVSFPPHADNCFPLRSPQSAVLCQAKRRFVSVGAAKFLSAEPIPWTSPQRKRQVGETAQNSAVISTYVPRRKPDSVSAVLQARTATYYTETTGEL